MTSTWLRSPAFSHPLSQRPKQKRTPPPCSHKKKKKNYLSRRFSSKQCWEENHFFANSFFSSSVSLPSHSLTNSPTQIGSSSPPTLQSLTLLYLNLMKAVVLLIWSIKLSRKSSLRMTKTKVRFLNFRVYFLILRSRSISSCLI